METCILVFIVEIPFYLAKPILDNKICLNSFRKMTNVARHEFFVPTDKMSSCTLRAYKVMSDTFTATKYLQFLI